MHIMSFLELKYCQTQFLMLSENTIANSFNLFKTLLETVLLDTFVPYILSTASAISLFVIVI